MSEPAPLPSPGELFADRYQIESGLGGGFESQVLGAIDRETGRRVAIKCWTAPHVEQAVASVRAFMRAAYASGAYEHPNIVEVFAAETEANIGYCVTEWLEGTTLARELQRVRPSPLEAVFEHVLPCMRAIAEAHAAGIVHGDLRPGHIFLCRATRHRGARPRVFDFGRGMPGFHELRAHKRPTLDEACHYTTPEQLQSAPLDARSDQYAFGVMLYEMLAGTLPFNADNGNDLALEIVAGSARPLAEIRSTLPDGLSEVVARAMATDPAERFADLSSMIEALEAFDTRYPSAAPIVSPPVASGYRARTRVLESPSAPVMSAYDWSFQDSSEPRPVAIPAPPPRNHMFLPRAALAGAITAAVVSAVYLDDDLFDRLSFPTQSATSHEQRHSRPRPLPNRPTEVVDPQRGTSTSVSAIEHAATPQPAPGARATPPALPRAPQPGAAPTSAHAPAATALPPSAAEAGMAPTPAVHAEPTLPTQPPAAAPAQPAARALGRAPEPVKSATEPGGAQTKNISAVERRMQRRKANAAEAIQRLESMQLQ